MGRRAYGVWLIGMANGPGRGERGEASGARAQPVYLVFLVHLVCLVCGAEGETSGARRETRDEADLSGYLVCLVYFVA